MAFTLPVLNRKAADGIYTSTAFLFNTGGYYSRLIATH